MKYIIVILKSFSEKIKIGYRKRRNKFHLYSLIHSEIFKRIIIEIDMEKVNKSFLKL
jgi:hypothetical protein